jgi:hypothetical protein
MSHNAWLSLHILGVVLPRKHHRHRRVEAARRPDSKSSGGRLTVTAPPQAADALRFMFPAR